MPRITVYSDGNLIADSGATTISPVIPPPPAPQPVIPPTDGPVVAGNGSSASTPKTLPAKGGLMHEKLNPGESRYYKADIDTAKNLSMTMASVDQKADCNMLLMEGTNAGIDAKYAEVLALYVKTGLWGSAYHLDNVTPRTWAVFNHTTSGETVNANKPFQSPVMFIKIKNEGATPAEYNLGFIQW